MARVTVVFPDPEPPTTPMMSGRWSTPLFRVAGRLPLVLARHFRGDFGWCFGIAVKALPVGAAAVGDGMERGRIAVELGPGHQGIDLGQAAVLLGREDLTPAGREGAQHVAEQIGRRPTLHRTD